MLKKILLAIFIIAYTFNISAQKCEHHCKKMHKKEEKMHSISKELQLSKEDSVKFSNLMKEHKKLVHRHIKKMNETIQSLKFANDNELEGKINQITKMKEEELDMYKKHLEDLKEFLTLRQVAVLIDSKKKRRGINDKHMH